MVRTMAAALAVAAGLTGAAWGAEPTVPLPEQGTIFRRAETTPIQTANWIGLRNGVEMAFVGASEARNAAQRALVANFAPRDPAVVKQPAKVIDAADELFGRFVILTAEQSGYSRVVINVKKADTKGALAEPVYEDFVYVRGANTVWLRQAGKEKWKIAQDPKFNAPPLQVLNIPNVGKVEIEAIAEIHPPNGARRAIGIDIRTDTPNKNQLQKYREIRATWLEADRATLQQRGYDLVAFQNFSAKRLGRFQVRDMASVFIQREQGKAWPEMPVLPPSKKSRAPLTAEGPAIDPAILTAAIGKAFQAPTVTLNESVATAVANLELVEDAAMASLAEPDPELQAKAFKASAPAE